jgi:hypothetical protein
VPNQPDKRVNIAEIRQEVWEACGKLSAWMIEGSLQYGATYPAFAQDGTPLIRLVEIGTAFNSARASAWAFNGNTNIIPTTITQNTDGSVTMSCVDHQGKNHSYTFTDW